MKKKATLTTLGIFLLIFGFAFAAQEGQDRNGRQQGRGRAQRPARVQSPAAQDAQADDEAQPVRPGVRRGPVTPDQRAEVYDRMLARRSQTHLESIQELEAIKKIAQEENATKTVAAIDALIAKKNEEYKAAQVEESKRRQEFRQRMQERMQMNRPSNGRVRPTRPAPARQTPEQESDQADSQQ